MLYEKYERRMKRHFSMIKTIIRYRVWIITILSTFFLLSSGYGATKGMVYNIQMPNSFVYGESITIESEAVFSKISYAYRSKGTTEWSDAQPYRAGDYEVKITTEQVFGRTKETILPFSILPKPIEIHVENTAIPFGSNPVLNVSLVPGDYLDTYTIVFSTISEKTTTFTVESWVIKDAQGVDVTNSYEVLTNDITLAFIPHVIEVVLLDVKSIYDGQTLTSDDYEISSGQLLPNHEIEIKAFGSQIDVGSSLNTILESKVTIDGLDVTKNYTIHYVDGQLEVTPRLLSIGTGTDEKIYDGTPLLNETFEILSGSLVEGHRLVVSTHTTLKDVGVIDNQLSLVVLDGSDKDVSSNYTLEYVYGSLTVLSREIEIQTSSAEKVYDGTALTNLGFEIMDGTLSLNETVHINTAASITIVGEVDNVFDLIIIDASSTDITHNYTIKQTYGQLKITPRPITITSASNQKVYDGYGLSDSAHTITSGSLVINHHTAVITTTEIFTVQSTQNIMNVDILDEASNNQTMNYLIEYRFGELEVTKRPITITTMGQTKVFDGTLLIHKAHEVTLGTLVFGHVTKVEQYAEQRYVGTIENTLTIRILDINEFDLTDNYAITMVYGQLEITPRPITIQPANITQIYQGTPISGQLPAIITGTLVQPHHIELVTSGSQTNVGESDNIIIQASVYNGLVDVSENYTITTQIGQIKVTPRPITVEPTYQSKIYDGTPLTSNLVHSKVTTDLIGGHDIVSSNIGSITNVGTTLNAIDDVQIYESSINVTTNYLITYETGILEVFRRPLTVESSSNQWVYDGQIQYDDTYTITQGSLVYSHNLTVISKTDILNKGTKSNIILVEIMDDANQNLSGNYQITYVYGTLEITPRPLTLETGSAHRTYDGVGIGNLDNTIIYGSLVFGHTIEVVSNTTMIEVGRVENIQTIRILDDTLTNQIANYDITYVWGILEITKRPITLQTHDLSKMYDGTPLFYLSMTVVSGSLTHENYVQAISYTTITDVGMKSNVLVLAIITNEGVDNTHNYEITQISGTLEVTPRTLFVRPTYATKVYDATPLTSNALEVSGGFGLVLNHHVSGVNQGSQTHAGSSKNNIISVSVYAGQLDVTHNYDIHYEDNDLVVTPRPITLVPEYTTKIYDGDPLTSHISNSKYPSDLIGGHTIVTENIGSRIDVGVGPNDIQTAHIFSGDEEVTSNYLISVETGFLEVTKRPITIQSHSGTHIYDGTYFYNTDFTLITGSLVKNHVIQLVEHSAIVNVGILTNQQQYDIVDTNNLSVVHNYNISHVYGTLEVTKRPITIQTASDQKIYDGTILSNATHNIIVGSLVLDHHTDVMSMSGILEVGIIDNEHNLRIINGAYEDVTDNYEIEFENGTLEVTLRPITITTWNNQKEYDGTALMEPNFDITAGTLVDTDGFILLGVTSITQVGMKDNILDLFIGRVETQTSTSHNYDITYVWGTLEITPRYIHIQTGSQSKMYDDTPLYELGFGIIEGSLAPNQYMNLLEYAEITDAGTLENTLVFSITDAFNQDVMANYDVHITYGTLTVTKRPLTYVTESFSKIYDATPLTNPNLSVILGSLVSTHQFEVTSYPSITNVGVISNELSIEIIHTSGQIKTSNYDLTIILGQLEIIPRPITIETGSTIKEYDGLSLHNWVYDIALGSVVPGQITALYQHRAIVEIGQIDNDLIIHIFDQDSNDVTYNYIITYVYGILKITPRNLVISTASDAKVYDGTPLFNHNWVLVNGSLLSNHTLSVQMTGSITEFGETFNTFEFEIIDELNQDVSMYYIVMENLGILRVESNKTVLIIQTESDSKVFDGTPLINAAWLIKEGQLLSGHTLHVEVTGQITEVGTTDNTMTYVIIDAQGIDVTDSHYDIIEVLGMLTVFDETENGQSNPGAFDISTSGNIGLDTGLMTTLFKVYSSINDMVYLRETSYGDYNKSGFDAPTPYVSPFNLSPLSFTSIAARFTYPIQTIEIKAMVPNLPYYLPYYATTGYHDNIDDISLNYTYGTGYSVTYIPIKSVDLNAMGLLQPVDSMIESVYRQHVYNTYLSIPADTKAGMLNLAQTNGINPYASSLISDVQNYIRGAAIYNLAFKPIPSGVDYALYFLEVNREGICQHFAMAATLMYRALGIPARYVTGVSIQTKANQWVNVTPMQGHAWVEIYIDGLGWVPMEVTPGGPEGTQGSSAGSGGGGTCPSGETCANLPNIFITSLNASKVYDGTPITQPKYYSDGNLRPGHTLIVNVTGQQTQVGESRNTFTYVVRDSMGFDVSNQYNIQTQFGLLVVVPNNGKPIFEIQAYDIKRGYTGSPIQHTPGDYWIPSKNLPNEYTLLVQINGSLTDIGKVETNIDRGSFRILDAQMMDVTTSFNVVFYNGSIEVTPRPITVNSNTVQKYYDGLPLVSNAYYLSKGTLLPGHIMTVSINTTITEVGSIPNAIESVIILNNKGEDVTSNYKITTINGLLTVKE